MDDSSHVISNGYLLNTTEGIRRRAKEMDITLQEQLMIEMIREQSSDDEFRLLVERQDGAWNITLSTVPHDESHKSRGTGASFNDAWDNMAPLWA
jgi:hypothetical protein